MLSLNRLSVALANGTNRRGLRRPLILPKVWSCHNLLGGLTINFRLGRSPSKVVFETSTTGELA